MNPPLRIDGAWEGDCYPGGRFCASYPGGRLQTHTGTWTPRVWLRYPVLNPVTDLVAGTTQSDPAKILEGSWDSWVDIGSACGNLASAYWPDGRLETNPDCRPPYYGLGIRYIADRIYTGDETRTDLVRRIWEFTERDGITVGQGGAGPYGEDPCIILYNGRRYLLSAGTCRVIRFNKTDDRLAIGFFDMAGGAFVAYWLTVADILTLQDITDPDDPDEPDEPDEPEEPVPLPNHKFVVDRVNTEHPDLLQKNGPDEIREFYQRSTNALHAHDPKWGMLTKTAGENHQVIDGERVALDAAAYLGTDLVIDFIASAGDGHPTSVTWGEKPRRETNLWLKPIPISEEPPPPDGDLEDRVAELERQVQDMRIHNAALAGRVSAHEDRIQALENAPPSGGLTPAQVVALIDAAFANAEITGRTQSAGGILSHSHGISGLAITRKG